MSDFVRADRLENIENCSGYKLKLRLLDIRAKTKKLHRRNYDMHKELKDLWKQKIDIKGRYKDGIENNSYKDKRATNRHFGDFKSRNKSRHIDFSEGSARLT
ncbi:MAG: hypothetical protein ABEI74_02160 [Candidatus Pacearchaeota archaeon]